MGGEGIRWGTVVRITVGHKVNRGRGYGEGYGRGYGRSHLVGEGVDQSVPLPAPSAARSFLAQDRVAALAKNLQEMLRLKIKDQRSTITI